MFAISEDSVGWRGNLHSRGLQHDRLSQHAHWQRAEWGPRASQAIRRHRLEKQL